MKKTLLVASFIMAMLLVVSGSASAHVAVSPDTGKPAAFETYTFKAPSEKEIPAIGLRLVLPAGFKYDSVGVKPGWKIDTVKKGDTVSEISWTGGSVPPEQFDTFQIMGQNPPKPTTLAWKAYQTYADGSVIAWTEKANPKKEGDESFHPASETKISEQSAAASPAGNSQASGNQGSSPVLPVAAIVISIAALIVAFVSRQSK